MASKEENNPKARVPATSLSSSFKKGINYFNCSYEGHYTHECRKPKRLDGGNAPKAQLNALEVHESDLGNVRESDGDHPNAEEQTGSPQDLAGDEPKFMDLMDIYLVINEEEDDNELVGYLRAMHPIEGTVMGSDNEIIYCRVINTIYRELPQQQLIPVDDKGQQVPKYSIGEDNQEWT